MMAIGNRKTEGKGSAEEREHIRRIEALPFVGDGRRNWWAVPKRGGYCGGCITGKAAAMAYLKFLRDDSGCGVGLQHVASDMFGRPRSESLMGQAVGFFSALDQALRQVAPLLNIQQDDDYIRDEFARGINLTGPRRAAYLKELHARMTKKNAAAKKAIREKVARRLTTVLGTSQDQP